MRDTLTQNLNPSVLSPINPSGHIWLLFLYKKIKARSTSPPEKMGLSEQMNTSSITKLYCNNYHFISTSVLNTALHKYCTLTISFPNSNP